MTAPTAISMYTPAKTHKTEFITKSDIYINNIIKRSLQNTRNIPSLFPLCQQRAAVSLPGPLFLHIDHGHWCTHCCIMDFLLSMLLGGTSVDRHPADWSGLRGRGSFSPGSLAWPPQHYQDLCPWRIEFTGNTSTFFTRFSIEYICPLCWMKSEECIVSIRK